MPQKPHRKPTWSTSIIALLILCLTLPAFASTMYSLPSSLPAGNPQVDTIWFRYFPAASPIGQRSRAVVILPPTGSTDTDPMLRRLADHLAASGIASAIMTLPYHGRRHGDRGTPASHFAGGPLSDVVHAYRQSASDASAVATWLQTRPDIDSSRIGIVGVSLGAIVTHLAMGLDPRFGVGVAFLGGGDLPDFYRHSILARIEEMVHPRHYTTSQLDQLAVVDPLTYADRNRPRRVLMVEAARDSFIPPRDAERLWNALGRPSIRWIDTNHLALTVTPESAFEITIAFLKGAWEGRDTHSMPLPSLFVPTIKLGVIVEQHSTPTAAVQWQFVSLGSRQDHMSLFHVDAGIGGHGGFVALGTTVTSFLDVGMMEHPRGGAPRTYASWHWVF